MEATLLAEKRESKGKNEARRLRAAGRIPGVLYGARSEGRTPEGTSVAVDPREVMRILRWLTTTQGRVARVVLGLSLVLAGQQLQTVHGLLLMILGLVPL